MQVSTIATVTALSLLLVSSVYAMEETKQSDSGTENKTIRLVSESSGNPVTFDENTAKKYSKMLKTMSDIVESQLEDNPIRVRYSAIQLDFVRNLFIWYNANPQPT